MKAQSEARWFVVDSEDRSRLNAVKRHFSSQPLYRPITSRRAVELASNGERPEMVVIDSRFPLGERPEFVKQMRRLLGSDYSVPIVQSFHIPAVAASDAMGARR
jgi:hypothetical protein